MTLEKKKKGRPVRVLDSQNEVFLHDLQFGVPMVPCHCHIRVRYGQWMK
jgi:hypothetical protein